MKLVTIAGPAGGSPGAVLQSGEIIDLRLAARLGSLDQWIPSSVIGILAGGDAGLALVGDLVEHTEASDLRQRSMLAEKGAILPESTRLLSPVPAPTMVVAAGLAYNSHLKEMSGTPPPRHPTGFLKIPASITGSGANVRLPPHAAEHMDYEGELAVIFGKHCHCVEAENSLDHVAGYSVANDFSARDWVYDAWRAEGAWEARLTWEVNIMGKQFPGFTAVGPWLVTRDELSDIGNQKLTTHINGQMVQESPISDTIFSLADTIAHFSRWYSFCPGDILLTGTPAGVGVGRKPPLFLKPGDRVEVGITS
ncbi:MAG: fumarylacetoacetate hydrolase family protein, partial [Sphingobium sp.]